MRPLLPPEALWLRVDELFSELKRWPRLQLKTDHLPEKAANTNLGFQKLPDLAIQAQQKAPLDALRKSSNLQRPGDFLWKAKDAAKRWESSWLA